MYLIFVLTVIIGLCDLPALYASMYEMHYERKDNQSMPNALPSDNNESEQKPKQLNNNNVISYQSKKSKRKYRYSSSSTAKFIGNFVLGSFLLATLAPVVLYIGLAIIGTIVFISTLPK
jgi:hypothetical protein